MQISHHVSLENLFYLSFSCLQENNNSDSTNTNTSRNNNDNNIGNSNNDNNIGNSSSKNNIGNSNNNNGFSRTRFTGQQVLAPHASVCKFAIVLILYIARLTKGEIFKL